MLTNDLKNKRNKPLEKIACHAKYNLTNLLYNICIGWKYN